MDNRNSKIYTGISNIEVSRVIVVLVFSTEISIEVLKWIIAILNFSTEMNDIEQSRVILVLFFSIEILTWLISGVSYVIFEYSNYTEILTWIIAIVKFIPKLVI